jgi:serine/threonine protein kinase
MPLFNAGLLIGGKYRVIRRIGAGGMGAVFEVENTALGGRAALKVLTINIHDQPEYFARFQNEARAANQSGHPCVVPVYDFGQLDDGTPWLVMPFLVGETLSARIARAKRSPQGALGPDCLWMIGDIASALRATHLHGIVHRDLKPANITTVEKR